MRSTRQSLMLIALVFAVGLMGCSSSGSKWHLADNESYLLEHPYREFQQNEPYIIDAEEEEDNSCIGIIFDGIFEGLGDTLGFLIAGLISSLEKDSRSW